MSAKNEAEAKEVWNKKNNEEGEFVRDESMFRRWVRADGSTEFQPDAGRYHLYVSYACPWAHRTLMVRSLRKLQDVITVSVVDPVWNQKGWWFGPFPGATPDHVNGKGALIDIYRMVDPGFPLEETVPVLWDKKTGTMVNNESREIIRMFDLEFRGLGDESVNLCPDDLRGQIDETIDAIYTPINNGVYRSGFATTQQAYERAAKQLFEALDHWESVLGRQRFLCGDALTEADICMFPTLYRFDSVYYSHFKTNLRRIKDYKNLWAYVRDIYQTSGVAETCRMDHVKTHYYRCHKSLNPTGIVPMGPLLNFEEPHGRG